MRVRWWGAAAVVLLAGGWSGAWLTARGLVAHEIDPALDRLRAEGTEIACEDRRITGWPFSLRVACGLTTVTTDDGSRIEANGLSIGGDAWDWRHIRLSATGPLRATLADGRTLVADFTRFEAAVHLAGRRPDGLAIVADGVSVDAGAGGLLAGRMTVGHVEAEAIADPDRPQDMTVAATAQAAGLAVDGRDLAPVPADLTVAARLSELMPVLAGGGRLEDWSAAGGKLLIQRADVALGDVSLDSAGEAWVAPDGLANGKLRVTARRLDALPTLAKAGGKPLSPELAGVGTAFLFFGSAGEAGARVIEIAVKDGEMSANGRKLGRLRPLF